jgi:hypothetical protein
MMLTVSVKTVNNSCVKNAVNPFIIKVLERDIHLTEVRVCIWVWLWETLTYSKELNNRSNNKLRKIHNKSSMKYLKSTNSKEIVNKMKKKRKLNQKLKILMKVIIFINTNSPLKVIRNWIINSTLVTNLNITIYLKVTLNLYNYFIGNSDKSFMKN